MDKRILAYILAFTTIIIWGSTFVITKVMLEYITPTQLLVFRYIIVVVFLSIIYPKFTKINLKTEWIFMISGLFLALYFIFENNALNQTFPTNVSLIIATIPLQTSILKSIVFRKSFFTKLGLLGVIISYVGVVIIVVDSSGVEGVKLLGDILAFLAAMAFAFYSIFLEKVSKEVHIIERTRKIFLYGLVVLLVYFFSTKEYQGLEVPNTNMIIGLLYLGVVASGLAFMMWNQSVKWIGSIKTNIFTYLVPVATLVFSLLFINEHITLYKVVGGLVIMGGIYISENDSHKKQEQ